jgi:hypothetical protein
MAVIELRHAPIYFKDGMSGTGAINEPTTAPVATDTNFDIDTIVLNTTVTTVVPVGARFTVAGETIATTIHTVTARTPTGTTTTTNIVFSPALGAGTYVDGGVVTFLPSRIEIKIGEGNLTYTETRNMEYRLDRGDLDTVREGDEAPMEVSLDFQYEYVRTGTGEDITPVDALKGINGAAEWVSSSTDACEPFAIDIELDHAALCGISASELSVFPDFRYDTLEFDLSAGTISTTGRCNATEPIVTRPT